ncbi:hypothetical protein F5879DRAFT_779132, partial [Lentinula edodes]|uniref:uncharacterized protein n=1 Tax=Lentinula edodes TaxID=5353 RepID=UPI001E8E1094
VTDAPHAQKTAHYQPQHGTHTTSLGTGYLVNQSLIDIYSLNGAGLQLRDVDNVDKQDDGAARRVFHFNVLQLMTETEDARYFISLYMYLSQLSCLGTLFEAWMNPTMSTKDRVLAALRARFWLNLVNHHI